MITLISTDKCEVLKLKNQQSSLLDAPAVTTAIYVGTVNAVVLSSGGRFFCLELASSLRT
jgi:hypothetical protein